MAVIAIEEVTCECNILPVNVQCTNIGDISLHLTSVFQKTDLTQKKTLLNFNAKPDAILIETVN